MVSIPVVGGMTIALVVGPMTGVASPFEAAFMLKTMLLERVIVLEVTGLMTEMAFMFKSIMSKGMRNGTNLICPVRYLLALIRLVCYYS